MHTALRAELAGVYCGVHGTPSDDCRLPRYILTDSQTSIFLISKAIHRPEALRTHKHKHLLLRIAQTLLAQDLPVHILKVRAHTGVRGNEIVDGLATDAHENPTTGPFCTAGRSGRGLHWVTYMYASPTDPTEAPTIRDTDDLHRHLITIAGKAQTKATLSNPEQSLLRKVNSMLNEHGGIDVQISAAVWTTTLLNPWQKKLVAFIRAQQLYTAYRRVQFTKLTGDAARHAAICQQCGKGVDDAHHALNMCTALQADTEIKLRHDNAVCKIAAAALKGRHAHRILHWDARSTSRKKRKSGASKIPAWLMPHDVQRSIPDLLQIDLPAGSDGTTRVSMEQRQNCMITIVEVKYAPDPDIQKAARTEALEQHTDLVKSLKARGWKRITVYPVIIGNAGTITNKAHAACEALGIQAAARITLLRALSIDSVRRTAAIWQPRLAKSIGQQPEPVDVPITEPQRTAPDPRPDNEQDQQNPRPPRQPAGTACCPDEPDPSAAAPSETQSDSGE